MMENTKSKELVLSAAQMAVTSDVNLMTCDRIDAPTGGHGMLNMAIHTVCNVIAEEMLHGGDLTVKFANVRHLPMEDIMKKAIDSAKGACCDRTNAALPTSKMNSKISGFAAVSAIYRAMEEGTLCKVRGYDIPAGVGVGPNPFIAAVIGAAAILEIIHPDAEVPESEGTYGRAASAYMVGKSAAETAGLPMKLHVKVTWEEYDTAQLIGDLALILKDIGAPSVIGMMSFNEILACFKEQISPGFSASPVNAPLGHQGAYAVAAMKALLQENVDQRQIIKALVDERRSASLDPESALLCLNISARKAAELHNGPVTKLLIAAAEPARTRAIFERASFTYDQIKAGKTITEVVTELDNQRFHTVESQASMLFSAIQERM